MQKTFQAELRKQALYAQEVFLAGPRHRFDTQLSLSRALPWGNEDTQKLIDILAKYDVKATFFVVGAWVDKYPESVKALSDAGHEVMNHSNDHAHFNSLSADQIIDNITACNEKVAAITGVTPTLFRPPYGEYDDRVITTVRSMGMDLSSGTLTASTGRICPPRILPTEYSNGYSPAPSSCSTTPPCIHPRRCPALSSPSSGRGIPSFRFPRSF